MPLFVSTRPYDYGYSQPSTHSLAAKSYGIQFGEFVTEIFTYDLNFLQRISAGDPMNYY